MTTTRKRSSQSTRTMSSRNNGFSYAWLSSWVLCVLWSKKVHYMTNPVYENLTVPRLAPALAAQT